jgi:diguanylate cyclase (GGDEF)-like protein
MNYLAIFLYLVSLLAQIGAVYVAATAYRFVDRYKVGWLILAAGLSLMLGRRIAPIMSIIQTHDFHLTDAILSVPISILLFVGVVTVRKIVIELSQAKAELLEMLRTDNLTLALSRAEIIRQCKQEIERSKRTGQTLAVLELDIDYFKQVNDRHGHHIGDEVLKGLSKYCLNYLRKMDSFGRIGGEEFIALLPNTNLDLANEIAERLRVGISELVCSCEDGNHICITVSIGIAIFDPANKDRISDKFTVETLLNEVDQAMYRAKQAGRNCVSV